MQDNRLIEILLGTIAGRGVRKHWFDGVVNFVGLLIVLAFCLFIIIGMI